MTKRDIEARELLIEAATALIREHGGTETVTTRDIAARAGVGVGLVNYHFQTKEHLLDLCTQRIISRVIGGFDRLHQSIGDMPPIGRLRFLVKENARFLADNPGISRASILHDLHTPGAGDNTDQTLQAYLPVVREVCGDKICDAELRVLLCTMIFTLQVAFLRGNAFGKALGLDLEDPAQRDQFVDLLIDRLFCFCL